MMKKHVEMAPNGKSLLIALYYAPNHKITGSVKFNKIIAKLYTEGHKKDVELALLRKGSAVQQMGESSVLGIQDHAKFWEIQGFITRNTEEIGQGYKDREDYLLTKKGITLAKAAINEIHDILLTEEEAKNIVQSLEKLSSKDASIKEHKEFFFDETDEKRKERIKRCIDIMQDKYKKLKTGSFGSQDYDIAGMIAFVKGVSNKIYKEKIYTKLVLGEKYLAHFYILKHMEDFCKLVSEKTIDNNSIKRKYLLIRHIAINSKIIHHPSSRDFEIEYFIDAEERKSLQALPIQ